MWSGDFEQVKNISVILGRNLRLNGQEMIDIDPQSIEQKDMTCSAQIQMVGI